MDNTIVVSSYGAIGNDLNELNRTSWIATAYLITTTSFQPLYGKLSDIFGRKASLLFAYAVFGLGCLFCGMSTSLEQLVAARVRCYGSNFPDESDQVRRSLESVAGE
jgi:MFS family permease